MVGLKKYATSGHILQILFNKFYFTKISGGVDPYDPFSTT